MGCGLFLYAHMSANDTNIIATVTHCVVSLGGYDASTLPLSCVAFSLSLLFSLLFSRSLPLSCVAQQREKKSDTREGESVRKKAALRSTLPQPPTPTSYPHLQPPPPVDKTRVWHVCECPLSRSTVIYIHIILSTCTCSCTCSCTCI